MSCADQPDPARSDARAEPSTRGRLNLLLSYGGVHDESAMDHLSRLLSPMGINSIHVHSGREATDVIQTHRIHIAVVDLGIPLDGAAGTGGAGGERILQLLRRVQPVPPTVVVRPPQAAARDSARGLAAALREGAFAVLDRPVRLETMLETMRRVVRRHYADVWPSP